MSENKSTPRIDLTKLADSLVADLSPVRRAPGLARVTLGWVALSLLVVAASIVAYHPRPDLAQSLTSPGFVVCGILFFGSAFTCAFIALRSGRPGRDFTPWTGKFLTFGFLTAAVVTLSRVFGEPAGFPVQVGLDPQGLHCTGAVLTMAALPAAGLFFFLRTFYASVRPKFTGRLLGAAAALLGTGAIAFHCPVEEGVHLFVWHFLPVLGFSWIVSRLAGRFLRF